MPQAGASAPDPPHPPGGDIAISILLAEMICKEANELIVGHPVGGALAGDSIFILRGVCQIFYELLLDLSGWLLLSSTRLQPPKIVSATNIVMK